MDAMLDSVGVKLAHMRKHACNSKNAVLIGFPLRVNCEGSHSDKQVFVSTYLRCIARPCIHLKKSTHKGTFPGVDCQGLHSSHQASIKTIVVRAIEKQELGVNLKRVL